MLRLGAVVVLCAALASGAILAGQMRGGWSIAYTQQDGLSAGWRLYLLDAERGHTVRLTLPDRFIRPPVISPDRRSVLWQEGSGAFHVYRIDQRRSQSLGVGQNAAWSPDSRAVIRLAQGWLYRHEIHPDRGPAVTLLTEQVAAAAPPLWSARSGQMIYLGAGLGNAGVYALPHHSAAPTLIYAATTSISELAISPDARWLAISAWDEGFLRLFLVDLAGGQQTRLTNRLGDDLAPAWSPDGARVAFIYRATSGLQALWLADADTLTAAAVPRTAPLQSPLIWSPDGTRIAYIMPTNAIVIVNLATGVIDPMAAGPRRILLP
jgi:hypothetical protein